MPNHEEHSFLDLLLTFGIALAALTTAITVYFGACKILEKWFIEYGPYAPLF